MKSFSRLLSVWVAGLLTLAAGFATAALPAGGGERGPARKASSVAAPTEPEARVIVKFKAEAGLMRALSAKATRVLPQHAQALSARLGLKLTDGRVIGARAQVLKGTGLSSRELAARIAAQGDVEYAVVDGRVRALAATNDPLFPDNQSPPITPAVGQWYLRAPTSATIVNAASVVSSINAQAAWDIAPGRGSVVVAVLDTGVRLDHPDLAPKLLPGYDFIAETATAADADGRDGDPSDPGDYIAAGDVGVVPGCTSGDVGDSTWHGTQTAGLIGAATNNGIGMAGAGRDVMLLPVRVLGKCGGYDSDILAAMLWASGLTATPVANPYPARVINLSLGSNGACTAAYADVVSQVNAAGVVVVAAAGNEGLAVGTPANCTGVIAVAGVRHAGTKVGYSDLGPEVVIAAPAGNCVNSAGTCLFPLLTTSNSGTTDPVPGAAGATYTSGGADASLGTSFSAPLVSGTVALMLNANAALTPAAVRDALRSSARAFPTSGAAATQRVAGGPFVAVAECVAPTSAAQDSECYCTASTCGAGLLDAGAAVARVATLTANIYATPRNAVVGVPVDLDGAGSVVAVGGAAITGYQWTISNDTSGSAFTGATNASTTTLMPGGVGTLTLSLTVTDSAGQQSTTSTGLTVSAVPAAPLAAAPSSDGGGAMETGWLLAWLASVIGMRVVTPRRRRD